MAKADLIGAARLLSGWHAHLPAWGTATPVELSTMGSEFQKAAPARLKEWAAARIRDHRFADAYAGLAEFAANAEVKGFLPGTTAADLARSIRTEVRTAEDEYHYTQLRALADNPAAEARLKQHLDAYLALVEPPPSRLGDVQRLADYYKWVKDGRPVKAIVRVEWGPRTAAREHTIEVGLGAGKDGQPAQSFTRSAHARPGETWTETFPVSGITGPADRIPYRVKCTRPTSPVEELAEGTRTRTELFLLDKTGPVSVADEADSGTRVTVEWQGIRTRPELPPWPAAKTPVTPVSLPR
jgi:hypothetical protein